MTKVEKVTYLTAGVGPGAIVDDKPARSPRLIGRTAHFRGLATTISEIQYLLIPQYLNSRQYFLLPQHLNRFFPTPSTPEQDISYSLHT